MLTVFKRFLAILGILVCCCVAILRFSLLTSQYKYIPLLINDTLCSTDTNDPLLKEIAKSYPYCSISQQIFSRLNTVDWKEFQQATFHSQLDSRSFNHSTICQEAVALGVELIPVYDFKIDISKLDRQFSCKQETAEFGDIFTGRIREDRPRIFDIFYFVPTDIDVILIRMYELNDSVDYFVILESELTERGHVRTLMFDRLKDKHFSQFMSKILYFKLIQQDFDADQVKANVHSNKTVWYFENKIRSSAYQKLRQLPNMKLKDSDLIISCDTDEIPPGEFIRRIKDCQLSSNKPIAFAHMLHHANYYWLLKDRWASQSSQPTLWIRSAILTVGELRRQFMDELNKVRHEANTFSSGLFYLYGGHHISWRATAVHSLFKMCSMCETGHYNHELMDALLNQQFHKLQRDLICNPANKTGFVKYQDVFVNNKLLALNQKYYRLPKLLRDYPDHFPYLHPRIAKMC